VTLQQFAAWLIAQTGAIDGRPQTTPPGNYTYLTLDGGWATRTNLARPDRDILTASPVCVGIDPAGARRQVQKDRDALVNARPDANHPLVELPSGPQLVDGTPTTGGERTSITLTYQLTTRRNR